MSVISVLIKVHLHDFLNKRLVMIANETRLHQSPNGVKVKNVRSPYGLQQSS